MKWNEALHSMIVNLIWNIQCLNMRPIGSPTNVTDLIGHRKVSVFQNMNCSFRFNMRWHYIAWHLKWVRIFHSVVWKMRWSIHNFSLPKVAAPTTLADLVADRKILMFPFLQKMSWVFRFNVIFHYIQYSIQFSAVLSQIRWYLGSKIISEWGRSNYPHLSPTWASIDPFRSIYFCKRYRRCSHSI
jgi:hypothetical protein